MPQGGCGRCGPEEERTEAQPRSSRGHHQQALPHPRPQGASLEPGAPVSSPSSREHSTQVRAGGGPKPGAWWVPLHW